MSDIVAQNAISDHQSMHQEQADSNFKKLVQPCIYYYEMNNNVMNLDAKTVGRTLLMEK